MHPLLWDDVQVSYNLRHATTGTLTISISPSFTCIHPGAPIPHSQTVYVLYCIQLLDFL